MLSAVARDQPNLVLIQASQPRCVLSSSRQRTSRRPISTTSSKLRRPSARISSTCSSSSGIDGITWSSLRHRHSPSLSAYEMRSVSERWMDEAPDHAGPSDPYAVPCREIWLCARTTRLGSGRSSGNAEPSISNRAGEAPMRSYSSTLLTARPPGHRAAAASCSLFS